MGLDLTVNEHHQLAAWLTSSCHNVVLLVNVEAKPLNKHLDARLLNVCKHIELVLQVENEELVFFFSSVQWVFQHQVFDVDQALLEVVVEELSVALFFGSGVNDFNFFRFFD